MKKASSVEDPCEPRAAGWSREDPRRAPGPKGRGLWLFVAAGFALLTAAYVVAFRVAHEAQIREVPVDRGGATP